MQCHICIYFKSVEVGLNLITSTKPLQIHQLATDNWGNGNSNSDSLILSGG